MPVHALHTSWQLTILYVFPTVCAARDEACTYVDGLHAASQAWSFNVALPIDDQYKGEQVDHQLYHPHHFLFWQLPEDLCDVYLMFPPQICPQVPE